MDRRDFLKGSLTMAAGVGLAGHSVPLAHAGPEGVKGGVQGYRPLGKTGFSMSDVSFGAGKLPSAGMILRAIDRGINYFDTAPDYGPSEDYIGEAMKGFKDRQKVFIASKFCQPIPFQAGKSHLQVGSSKADYIGAVENSLKRMNLDYLDVVFVHAIGELPDYEGEKRRLLDENMLAAFQSLKQAGKAKYLAVSSHGAHNLEKLMLDAVACGHYDAMMVAFNFMKFPQLPEVLKAAHQKGMGVIAMKTQAGAKESGLQVAGAGFEQAALKWVLKHPEVSGLVITMAKVGDFDLYLPASGQGFTAADQRVLDVYASRYGEDYCRTGCGSCESACPSGVPVATILRQQMYFANYGQEKMAMGHYAGLAQNAQPCQECTSRACQGACEYGLPVADKLVMSHGQLSFPAVG